MTYVRARAYGMSGVCRGFNYSDFRHLIYVFSGRRYLHHRPIHVTSPKLMDALFEGTDTSFRGSDSSIGTLTAKQGKTERISRGRQTVDTETETYRLDPDDRISSPNLFFASACSMSSGFPIKPTRPRPVCSLCHLQPGLARRRHPEAPERRGYVVRLLGSAGMEEKSM